MLLYTYLMEYYSATKMNKLLVKGHCGWIIDTLSKYILRHKTVHIITFILSSGTI